MQIAQAPGKYRQLLQSLPQTAVWELGWRQVKHLQSTRDSKLTFEYSCPGPSRTSASHGEHSLCRARNPGHVCLLPTWQPFDNLGEVSKNVNFFKVYIKIKMSSLQCSNVCHFKKTKLNITQKQELLSLPSSQTTDTKPYVKGKNKVLLSVT